MNRFRNIFAAKFGVQPLGCLLLLLASCFCLLAPSTARAQYRQDRLSDAGPATVPNPTITEKSGANIPLDLEFTRSDGARVKLADEFQHGRPVILSLVYFSCPYLCGVTQDKLCEAVRHGPLGLVLGQDYDIVVVSIDPDDTSKDAALKRKNYLAKIPLPESQPGFTYLTGTESNIKTLADTVGFGYRRNFSGDKFLHSSGIFICTPDGHLSQTIAKIDYQPDELHNALRLASNGKIGGGLLGIALSCGTMKYNPATGQYEHNKGFWIMFFGMLITFIALVTFLSILWRGEFKKNKHPFTAPPPPATT